MAHRSALRLGPLLLLSLCASSTPVSLLRRLGEHLGQIQDSSSPSLSLGPGAVAIPKQGWLEQPLDPFNASDTRSFLQRYWVNDQHWTSQRGPVFLHLGGESSLRSGSVLRGHPTALAPAWGALVIGLEHRFYGLSVPAGGLDVAQLRFLSSRHALADVASARLALARLFNVSSSSPWICFGGSYAGSLAAWARLKVPGARLSGRGRVPISGAGVPTSSFTPPAPHPPSPQRSSPRTVSARGHRWRAGPGLRPPSEGETQGQGTWGPGPRAPQADGGPPSVPPPHFRIGRLLRSSAGHAGFLRV
uniref:Serine protease 16 n=1 Tax=Canis lupus dingo TaxID=286419 RepID=A0A8C0JPT2_CANLU